MIEKLVVNGTEIQLNRSGEGSPLLFLHPSIGVGRSEEFLGALSLAFEVIAPSHPGFDESQVSNEITSADDLAYFYLDLIAQLDLRGVILVGASLGGWVALEMLTKTSDRIAGAVLLDSVGVKFGGAEDIDIADIFTLSQADWASRAFHDPGLDRSKPADISDEELLLVARNREATARIAWLPCLYNPKLRQRLHRIDVPTLLLWGAGDRIVLPSYGEKLAEALPGSRLEIITECGHLPHIERAAIAARSVMDFARSIVPATKTKLSAAS